MTLRMELQKVVAFARRDWIIESSYKVAILLRIATSFGPTLVVYFVAKLVPRSADGPLAGGYFAFTLVGIAMSQYLLVGLRTFGGAMRRAQMTGVLEALLSTRTSATGVVLYSAVSTFLWATLDLALVVVLGLLFGLDYSNARPLAVLATVILTVLTFAGLGIISAATVVLLKKGDPIELIIGSVSAVIGGAYFPTELLPGWAQAAAKFVPMTHALVAMRSALLDQGDRGAAVASMIYLAVLAAALLPAGLLLFRWAVRQALRDGTLAQY